MRLSMEEVQNIKASKAECQKNSGKVLGCGTCKCLSMCSINDGLIDTIEAKQQEIEQHIKWNEEHTKARADQQKEIEELKNKCLGLDTMLKDCERENRQLKAQAAAMREALSEAIFSIELGRVCSIGSLHNVYLSQIGVLQVNKWRESISSDAVKDYHNPADVEALETAKTALMQAECHCRNNYHCWRCRALAAIEKALGGEQK